MQGRRLRETGPARGLHFGSPANMMQNALHITRLGPRSTSVVREDAYDDPDAITPARRTTARRAPRQPNGWTKNLAENGLVPTYPAHRHATHNDPGHREIGPDLDPGPDGDSALVFDQTLPTIDGANGQAPQNTSRPSTMYRPPLPHKAQWHALVGQPADRPTRIADQRSARALRSVPNEPHPMAACPAGPQL